MSGRWEVACSADSKTVSLSELGIRKAVSWNLQNKGVQPTRTFLLPDDLKNYRLRLLDDAHTLYADKDDMFYEFETVFFDFPTKKELWRQFGIAFPRIKSKDSILAISFASKQFIEYARSNDDGLSEVKSVERPDPEKLVRLPAQHLFSLTPDAKVLFFPVILRNYQAKAASVMEELNFLNIATGLSEYVEIEKTEMNYGPVMTLSPDGKLLMIQRLGWFKSLRGWHPPFVAMHDAKTGKRLWFNGAPDRASRPFIRAALLSDSKTYVRFIDSKLSLRNAFDNKEITKVNLPTVDRAELAICPKTDLVVLAGDDGKVRVFDPKKMK